MIQTLIPNAYQETLLMQTSGTYISMAHRRSGISTGLLMLANKIGQDSTEARVLIVTPQKYGADFLKKNIKASFPDFASNVCLTSRPLENAEATHILVCDACYLKTSVLLPLLKAPAQLRVLASSVECPVTPSSAYTLLMLGGWVEALTKDAVSRSSYPVTENAQFTANKRERLETTCTPEVFKSQYLCEPIYALKGNV